MTFSLVFLLKKGKLRLFDYLRNKAHSSTLNFAFCNLHEQISNIYKKIKNSKTLTWEELASLNKIVPFIY